MTREKRGDDIAFADQVREAYQQFNNNLSRLSEATGLARSTLRDILSGATHEPTELTQLRFRAFMNDVPPSVTQRASTTIFEHARFSDQQLANIQPPRGSQSFRLIYRTDETESGLGSTKALDIATFGHPVDYVRSLGIDPSVVRGVIFKR